MRLFNFKQDIPFMNYGKITTIISLMTFILAIFSLYSRGLNLSVEFTGGTLMEVSYAETVNLQKIRTQLSNIGFDNATVQNLGTGKDILIRIPNKQTINLSLLSNKIFAIISTDGLQPQLKSVEFIGPEVGKDLVTNGLLAILFVCIGIILYLTIRFEWRFAIAAIIANLHDVIIILGLFAFFHWEFSLTTLAAVLAVLGYSVNESVVVFDRIRENFRIMSDKSVAEIINNAITATMNRTIITHGCTEMMVLSMLLFGGIALHSFALALTIGIIFGIYSSVLVASPLIMFFGIKHKDLIKPIKDKEGIVV